MNSAIVVLSETALALYPILIKNVPTDIGTQLVSRLLTYTVLGFSLASLPDIKQTWGTAKGITRSGSLGFMTLLHVLSSYVAFQELPAGISMSLFYSYPIFNLLGAGLFFGETFGIKEILLVGVAFTGVLIVAYQAKDELSKSEGFTVESLNWKGILAGLTAAITESGMYFAVRTASQPNPFYAVLELYPAALPLLLAGLFMTGRPIDTRGSVWLPMILFNTFIGFVGYCLRFYAVPRLPTLVFSILSFIGVIASFVWGYLFVGEIPSWLSVLGGTMITAAAGMTSSS
jgi:drug/metabolite transporter (DMT)-like permease